MATTTRAAGRTCRLDGDVLGITAGGKTACYLLARIPAETADEAFELQKYAPETGEAVGEPHHVSRDGYGWHCDCADATFRGHERPCRHAAAVARLRQLGRI